MVMELRDACGIAAAVGSGSVAASTILRNRVRIAAIIRLCRSSKSGSLAGDISYCSLGFDSDFDSDAIFDAALDVGFGGGPGKIGKASWTRWT